MKKRAGKFLISIVFILVFILLAFNASALFYTVVDSQNMGLNDNCNSCYEKTDCPSTHPNEVNKGCFVPFLSAPKCQKLCSKSLDYLNFKDIVVKSEAGECMGNPPGCTAGCYDKLHCESYPGLREEAAAICLRDSSFALRFGKYLSGCFGQSNTKCWKLCVKCEEGYANCDIPGWSGNDENGCETDIQNDPDNCGDCGVHCGSNEECIDGSCYMHCHESDGGKIFGEFGKCTDSTAGSPYSDNCNGNILNEYYCQDDSCAVESPECAGGCSNGECLCGFNVDEPPVVSISPDCGTDGCNIGEQISLTGKFTDGCDAVDTLVMEMSGSGPNGQCSFNVYSTGQVDSNGLWSGNAFTVMYVPNECIGAHVTRQIAKAYDTDVNPSEVIVQSEDISGEFDFSDDILSLQGIKLFPVNKFDSITLEEINFRAKAFYSEGDPIEITSGNDFPILYVSSDLNKIMQPNSNEENWKFFTLSETGPSPTVTAHFPVDEWNPGWQEKTSATTVNIESSQYKSQCGIGTGTSNPKITAYCDNGNIGGKCGDQPNDEIEIKFDVKKACFSSPTPGLKKFKIGVIDDLKWSCSKEFGAEILPSDCNNGLGCGNVWCDDCTKRISVNSVPSGCESETVFAYYLGLYENRNKILNYMFDPQYNDETEDMGNFQFYGESCKIEDASIEADCGDGNICGDEFGDKVKLTGTFTSQCDPKTLKINVKDISGACDYPMQIACSGSGCSADYKILGVPEECFGAHVKTAKATLIEQDGTEVTKDLTGSEGFYFADSDNAIVLQDVNIIPDELPAWINDILTFYTYAQFEKQGNLFWYDVTSDDLTNYLSSDEGKLEQQTEKNKFKAIEATEPGNDVEVSATYPIDYPNLITDESLVDIYSTVTDCKIYAGEVDAECGDNGCEEGETIKMSVTVDSACFDSEDMDKFKMIALGDGCEADMLSNVAKQDCTLISGNYECPGEWTVDGETYARCKGIENVQDGASVDVRYIIAYYGETPLDMIETSIPGYTFWPIIEKVHADIRAGADTESIEGKNLESPNVLFNGSQSYYLDGNSNHVTCKEDSNALKFTWTINGQTLLEGNCNQKKFTSYTYSTPQSSYQVKLRVTRDTNENEITNTFGINHCVKSGKNFFQGKCAKVDNQGYKCEEPCPFGICATSRDCHSGGDCGCGAGMTCGQGEVCTVDLGASECETIEANADEEACLGVSIAACYWDFNDPLSYFPLPPKCKHCQDESTNYDYGTIEHCSNYVSELSCTQDNCVVGNLEHGECPPGYTCPPDSYKCEFAAACELVYTKTLGPGNPDETCHETREYKECIGGIQNVDITTECCTSEQGGSQTACEFNANMWQTSKATETKQQICGATARPLPAFSWFNVFAVIFIIGIYYMFIIKRGKKR